MKYQTYTTENAPEASKALLGKVKKAYGMVPNLMGVLAESAPVLQSYMEQGERLAESTLTPQEVQVLYLAISFENDCHYCMAAHSTVALGSKVPEHIVQALRDGKTLDDPRLNALATFAKKVTAERGWVSEESAQAFLSAGFTKANILDVILGVSQKTISNYVNHINVTEVDAPFQKQEWKKP